MRGAPGWALGAAAVVLTLVVATVSAGNIEEDIDGLWETTGGDMVRKLVMDMENDAVAAGRKLIKFLRSQDNRIVRIQLSAEARGKQVQFANTEGVVSILKMLKQKDSKQRAIAAELIHLVATENSPISQRIGLHAWLPGMAGVRELLEVVDSGLQINAEEDIVIAGEEAAHSVWAMMHQSVDNLEMAHDRKGGEVMRDVIIHSKSPRLKMWAAACLKRLLSDFHNTPDGTYSSNSRIIQNNDRLRQMMGKDEKLVKALVHMVDAGKVTEDTPRSEWPTYAEISDRLSPSIQAWAAAGALGTLAASEANHDVIRSFGGVSALCSLKQSPCALERVEAESAIAALDVDCSRTAENKENWAGTEL